MYKEKREVRCTVKIEGEKITGTQRHTVKSGEYFPIEETSANEKTRQSIKRSYRAQIFFYSVNLLVAKKSLLARKIESTGAAILFTVNSCLGKRGRA